MLLIGKHLHTIINMQVLTYDEQSKKWQSKWKNNIKQTNLGILLVLLKPLSLSRSMLCSLRALLKGASFTSLDGWLCWLITCYLSPLKVKSKSAKVGTWKHLEHWIVSSIYDVNKKLVLILTPTLLFHEINFSIICHQGHS